MGPGERQRLRSQLVRLKEGDRSAFTAVYATLRPLVVAFARRLVGPEQAEDAAQQALVKLFAQASAYDESKDVAAWALALTAWECRTLRTKHRRRNEVALSAVEHELSHDPRETLFQRKVVEEARAVLATLSALDQQTLLSAFSDEGSGPTFRKRKQRALARLISAWRVLHG